MTPKQDAMRKIVELVKEHHISIQELESVLGRQQIDASKKDTFTLTLLFSYMGGIFILAGVCFFVALSWNHLNTFVRIMIPLGAGIASLLAAFIMAENNKREQNIIVLFILSALFECIGLFVTLSEFSRGGGNIHLAELLVFGALGIQYGILFLKLKRTILLFFTIYFLLAAFVNICELLSISHYLTELFCGGTVLALSYGIQRTPYNSLCGFGYFLSSIILLWMGFHVLKGHPIEIVYFGFACFMLYVSTIVRSKSILITSAIAIFSYVSYFTAEHFVNSVGWPLCLILLGLIFFMMSHWILKLNKHFYEAY